jgi:hypothetical protein
MADVLSLVFDSRIDGLLPSSLVIKSPFVARPKELNNHQNNSIPLYRNGFSSIDETQSFVLIQTAVYLKNQKSRLLADSSFLRLPIWTKHRFHSSSMKAEPMPKREAKQSGQRRREVVGINSKQHSNCAFMLTVSHTLSLSLCSKAHQALMMSDADKR